MFRMIKKFISIITNNEESISEPETVEKGYIAECNLERHKTLIKGFYYPRMSSCIERIFEGLDELKECEDSKYLSYVASVEAELPRNYAEIFPFDDLTDKEVRRYCDALEDLLLEVQDQQSQSRKEAQRRTDLETGRLSLEILGTDTVVNLDEVLRKQREVKDEERDNKLRSVSLGLSAIKGNKASLAAIFNNDNHIEESAAREESAIDANDGSDDDIADTGGNPKVGT